MSKTFLESVDITSDGMAQLIFKSTGRGDITVIAESEGLTSNEVILHDYLYAPPFTSEHPTPTTRLDSGYQVSQANGELTLIGGCISDGWSNSGLWECELKKNKVEQTLDDLYDQIISECNINDAKNSG